MTGMFLTWIAKPSIAKHALARLILGWAIFLGSSRHGVADGIKG